MARITSDPGLLECPDFASPTYVLVRAPLINDNTTEAQAIQLLKDVWSVGNEADKIRWQLQNDEDQAAHDEQLRLRAEADDLRAQAEVEEAEATRKDELKKNKTKYIPIPDRDVPTISRVIAANYAIRKMEKGLYVELWYYTNAGLDEAFRNSNTVDDEAMTMLRLPNGSTSWVPAAAAKTSSNVVEDKNILWEDFCQAAPRMIVAMEEADWPQERVAMLAKFWGNLQIHELRSSRDPLDQRTLIVYQAEQRRLWHLAIASPQGAYNLSRINEEVMRKTREKVYWDERRLKDYHRDSRVRPNSLSWLILSNASTFLSVQSYLASLNDVSHFNKRLHSCISRGYMLHCTLPVQFPFATCYIAPSPGNFPLLHATLHVPNATFSRYMPRCTSLVQFS